MNVVFFGSDFGIPTLKTLLCSQHKVCGIVVPPPRQGRLNHLREIAIKLYLTCFRYSSEQSPYFDLSIESVKEYIKMNSIPIYSPAQIRDSLFINTISAIKPDIIVCAGYTKIFPKDLIKIPQYGCINLHPSLLPNYRGPSPVFWQIVNGEHETGVTVHFIDEGVDTGNIIYQENTLIGNSETNGELFLRLAKLGGSAVLKAISQIDGKFVTEIIQNNNKASYCHRMIPNNVEIKWTESAKRLSNLVRSGSPWPGAYVNLKKGKLIIWDAVCSNENCHSILPGTVMRLNDQVIDVATGLGILTIRNASLGTKRLSIKKIIKKLKLVVGSSLY